MIDENNFKQVLFEYAAEKYGEKFLEFYDKFFDEFPYDIEGLPDELHFKNFIDWLIIEKPLPHTGKTVVEEFVDEHSGLDEEMKQKLLQMKNVISSEFVVISKKQLNLKIKDRKSEKMYTVVLYSNNPDISSNTIIKGRIHAFGDHYKFAGIFTTYNSPMIMDSDILMSSFNERSIKDAENIILSANTKLTAILNKYPFQWVDGICEQLSIDARKKNIKAKMIAYKLQNELADILKNIPDKSKEALKLVLNNNGYVNYGQLKEYDDEITFWWNEDPPTSTVGILRLNALLVVGKMPMKGRMYKVALIPKDIREELEECFIDN
jgi:hypothetical protein